MADHYTLATCSYRQFRLDMGIPVRISLGVPKHSVPGFAAGRWIKPLTPGGDYFRASHDEFDRRFYGQLDDIGVTGIVTEFERIAAALTDEEPRLVLLCFETVPVFTGTTPEDQLRREADVCHRRMFARWWLANTGELIPELRSGTARHMAATLW